MKTNKGGKMKKLFWRGLLLLLLFLFIFWAAKAIVANLTNIWKEFYNLLIFSKIEPALNNLLLPIFSLVATFLVIVGIGILFSLKIRRKSLIDLLIKSFSQIPGIGFVIKLISQAIEASDLIQKRKLKLAVYKTPSGRNILGAVKLETSKLICEKKKAEEVMSFYEAFTPYLFSGRPYLISTKYLYEVTNISFQDYIKYTATAGIFFKLPKKIFLKALTNNHIEEISTSSITPSRKNINQRA